MNSNLFSAVMSGLAIYLVIITAVAVALDFAVGKFAEGRGLSFKKYFWLAFFLSPLVAFIVAYFKSQNDPRVFEGSTGAIRRADGIEFEKCPMCAEVIKIEAKICKHCGASVGDQFAEIRHARDSQRELSRLAEIEFKASKSAARKDFFRKRSTKILILTLALLTLTGIAILVIVRVVQDSRTANIKATESHISEVINSCVKAQGYAFADNIRGMGFAFSLDDSQFDPLAIPETTRQNQVKLSISFNLPSELDADERPFNAAECVVRKITGRGFSSTARYGVSEVNYGRGYSFDLVEHLYEPPQAFILITKGF